jgi:hypothetical protein
MWDTHQGYHFTVACHGDHLTALTPYDTTATLLLSDVFFHAIKIESLS